MRPSKRASVEKLPEYVFELIGKTVADRLDVLTAEYRSELAIMRAQNADLRADNAELKGRIAELVDRLKADVAARLAELKPPSEISEEDFQRRIDSIMRADVPALQMKQQPLVINVPVIMPKKGKEVMTVELDDAGRIKRSVKEEID